MARTGATNLYTPVFDNGPGGFGYKRVGEKYKEYSPLHNVKPGQPPAVVYVGEKDGIVPPKTVLAFRDALKAAGNRCDAHVYPGEPHDVDNDGRDDRVPFEVAVESADQFLADLGWRKGSPAVRALPLAWSGKLLATAADGMRQETTMTLDISSAAGGRFDWTATHEDAARKTVVMEYGLVPVPDKPGRFEIDEKNGAKLDTRRTGA